MIKIYLLIGFLGAGKTTLMQRLLKSYEDEKIGVIVNDFGESNVDARLIENEGMRMTELSNGSIFCACIKDKFIDSLIEMSAMDIDFMFIEASGLADPANMGQILDGISHKTTNGYQLTGSVCVADAVHFTGLADILPALENQVGYANAVILNKADLADEETIAAASEKIHEINPDVPIFVTSWCQVDLKEITSRFATVKRESKDSTNTVESRPQSFILKAAEPVQHDGLLDFLKEVAPASYRIKGFIKTDKGDYEVSCVSTDIRVSAWPKPVEKTELVAISAVGIKLLSMLLSASGKYVGGKLKL